MDEGNLAVLVDAKTEYTKQLINVLKTSIYMCIYSIFIKSKFSTFKQIIWIVFNSLTKFVGNPSINPELNQPNILQIAISAIDNAFGSLKVLSFKSIFYNSFIFFIIILSKNSFLLLCLMVVSMFFL